MQRYDCLKVIAQDTGSALAVCTGWSAREWWAVRPSDGNLKTRRLLQQTQAQAAAIAATEERSRLILGSIDEGILGLDIEGRASFINPAGRTCAGATASQSHRH